MHNTAKTLIQVLDLIENCLKSISKFMTFRIKGRYLDSWPKAQFDLYANPGPFSSFRVTCSCLTKYL